MLGLKAKLISAAILAAFLYLSISHIFNLRNELAVANTELNSLKGQIKAQNALSQIINNVSKEAIQQKAVLEDDESKVKTVVKTVIKQTDCANVAVPAAAADRLRDYANRVRNNTSTN